MILFYFTSLESSSAEFVVYWIYFLAHGATISIVSSIMYIFAFVVYRFITNSTHDIIFCKSFTTKGAWFM